MTKCSNNDANISNYFIVEKINDTIVLAYHKKLNVADEINKNSNQKFICEESNQRMNHDSRNENVEGVMEEAHIDSILQENEESTDNLPITDAILGKCGNSKISQKDKHTYYMIDSSHAGYIYLVEDDVNQQENFGLVIRFVNCVEFIEEAKTKVETSSKFLHLGEGHLTGPSFAQKYNTSSIIIDRDFVFGLRCSNWPYQANEWLSRIRNKNWPRKQMIVNIVSMGCHIVPVSSHGCIHPMFEWRLSFSKAELMLVKSLPRKLKLAYVISKTLIKTALKRHKVTMFASYHLKTTFLWFIECHGLEILDGYCLEDIITLLLSHLLVFYQSGFVPNYFVRFNNMIDHRSNEEIQLAMETMQRIQKNLAEYLAQYIENCHILPVSFDNSLDKQVCEDINDYLQHCKYNFLGMVVAIRLKDVIDAPLIKVKAPGQEMMPHQMLYKARAIHNFIKDKESLPEAFSKFYHDLNKKCEISEKDDLCSILDLVEDYLAADELKVTNASAVALGIFNVSLTFLPTGLLGEKYNNKQEVLIDIMSRSEFLKCLSWSARVHNQYCNVIYDFVLSNWPTRPIFVTEDALAALFSNILTVVFGQPTKQSKKVIGCLVKKSMTGSMFMLTRMLSSYLLQHNLELAYVAYQATSYLMGTNPTAEIVSSTAHGYPPSIRQKAAKLLLSKVELQTSLSSEEIESLRKKWME